MGKLWKSGARKNRNPKPRKRRPTARGRQWLGTSKPKPDYARGLRPRLKGTPAFQRLARLSTEDLRKAFDRQAGHRDFLRARYDEAVTLFQRANEMATPERERAAKRANRLYLERIVAGEKSRKLVRASEDLHLAEQLLRELQDELSRRAGHDVPVRPVQRLRRRKFPESMSSRRFRRGTKPVILPGGKTAWK